MTEYAALATVAVLLLAACGGSSTTSQQPALTPNAYSTLARQQTDFAARNTSPRATAVMPTVGSATYRGVASFSTADADKALSNPDVVGRIELSANFAAPSISASLSGLVDRNNTPLAGELAVSNAPIKGNSFQGNLTGSVTNAAGARTTSGTLVGGFFGQNAELVIGAIGAKGGALPPEGVFSGSR